MFLDGKQVQDDGQDIRTVGDLMRRLDGLSDLERRIVQSIAVDGLEIFDWWDNCSVELPAGARIDVRSQSVSQLLVATAQSAQDYIPRLQDGGVQAATLLQEGRDQEAFRLVGQLVEGLQWYSEFLGNVATLAPGEEERAAERLEALGAVMEQLLRAWEAHDHTLLADLLEYGLTTELQQSLEYVHGLSQSGFVDVRTDR